QPRRRVGGQLRAAHHRVYLRGQSGNVVHHRTDRESVDRSGATQHVHPGAELRPGGNVAVSKLIIPPVPVPSFGAVCIQQTGSGKGVIDCNGDAGEAQPDVLDYRTFQDHVTNDEDPNCQFGCKEGSGCPGPSQPPPAPDWPRCVSEPGVCAAGQLVGQACQLDSQCPGKEKTRDPVTGEVICTATDCGACNTTMASLDERQLPHPGTCVGPGPRKGLWCDVDGDCPSDCLAKQPWHHGPTDTGTPCSLGPACRPDRRAT